MGILYILKGLQSLLGKLMYTALYVLSYKHLVKPFEEVTAVVERVGSVDIELYKLT